MWNTMSKSTKCIKMESEIYSGMRRMTHSQEIVTKEMNSMEPHSRMARGWNMLCSPREPIFKHDMNLWWTSRYTLRVCESSNSMGEY